MYQPIIVKLSKKNSEEFPYFDNFSCVFTL